MSSKREVVTTLPQTCCQFQYQCRGQFQMMCQCAWCPPRRRSSRRRRRWPTTTTCKNARKPTSWC
uniref:Uncharacterized protein n=1 Tax=Arundo donax TaxID=35708 RepID=A0A0A9H4T6_ARUDO